MKIYSMEVLCRGNLDYLILLGCLFSYCRVLRVLYIIWIYVLCQKCDLQIISPSLCSIFFFILITVFFSGQKNFLTLIKQFINLFVDQSFVVLSNNSLSNQKS